MPARVVSSETVRQTIDGAHAAEFIKEVIRVPLRRGAVAMVRKRAMNGTPKGAVMMIHGFGQNRYTWHLRSRSLVNYLANEGFDVYNLELRGHGRSRIAGSKHPRSFEEYVEQDGLAALEAACELGGHERVFVMGHSLGGAVAYGLAGHAPERVAGVISVAGVFFFGGQKLFKHASRLYRLAGDWIDPVLGFVPFIPVDLAGRLLIGAKVIVDNPLFGRSPLQVWYPGTMEKEILAERMTRGMDRTGFGVLRQMIEWAATGEFKGAHSQRDYAEAFANTSIPLLVLAADRDKLCTAEDCRAGIDASRSHDKTYMEFGPRQGGQHWGHVDLICGARAPKYVWPFIARWLSERVPNPQQ